MPTDHRKKLGEQLVRRRVELSPRYSNRQVFATETGVHYRVISDIERGRRGNYEAATIAALEVAYRLAPGSLAPGLAGADLEPLPTAQAPPVPPPSLTSAQALFPEPGDDLAAEAFPDDPTRRRILRLLFPPVSESPDVVATLFRALNNERRKSAESSREDGTATAS